MLKSCSLKHLSVRFWWMFSTASRRVCGFWMWIGTRAGLPARLSLGWFLSRWGDRLPAALGRSRWLLSCSGSRCGSGSEFGLSWTRRTRGRRSGSSSPPWGFPGGLGPPEPARPGLRSRRSCGSCSGGQRTSRPGRASRAPCLSTESEGTSSATCRTKVGPARGS